MTLELGGKNPNVIFADADLDAAVAGRAGGRVRELRPGVHRRQPACIVERKAQDELVERLSARAGEMRVAAGWDPQVDVGPLVSGEQLATVLGHVQSARQGGARLATGEPELEGAGHFMRPTVLADVAPAMPIFRDEVFGPVVSVTPFETADEGIGLANATRYGLAAGGVDAGRRPGARRGAPDPRRDGVDQRLRLDPPGGAVRRLRRVGPRPRARRTRPGRVHRAEVRLPHRLSTARAAVQRRRCPTRIRMRSLPTITRPSNPLRHLRR